MITASCGKSAQRSIGGRVATVMLALLAVIGPGSARADIRPPRPRPPARPTFAGRDLPRPLHVVVAGLALGAAAASAGLLYFRRERKWLLALRVGALLAAIVVVTSASALAYWSYSTEKHYEAVKAKQLADYQADYEARWRNFRGRGPVRPPGPPGSPAPNAGSARVGP